MSIPAYLNYREALIALAQGMQIRGVFWPVDEYVFLHNVNDTLTDELGETKSLELVYNTSLKGQLELYEPPNPHPNGSFFWAREEAKRGNRMRRSIWVETQWLDLLYKNSKLSLEDIDATDWEVLAG